MYQFLPPSPFHLPYLPLSKSPLFSTPGIWPLPVSPSQVLLFPTFSSSQLPSFPPSLPPPPPPLRYALCPMLSLIQHSMLDVHLFSSFRIPPSRSPNLPIPQSCFFPTFSSSHLLNFFLSRLPHSAFPIPKLPSFKPNMV